MIQIAVYGKGGIGKSTTSSNLSYVLASSGLRVIQIGCDPKHDSTRSLLKGSIQRTVLDYVRETPVLDRRLEDVMVEGVQGIGCIEAGGPEPGIGCAGRGILTMFETLDRLGLGDIEKDVVVYDVLGDVVCGGFAVPMRREHSDAVYIVTSGEFMSIYAANNILRGLGNFSSDIPRVAGLILNERGSPEELDLVTRFAEATNLPVIARVPRSAEFMSAEMEMCTVSELFPDSVPASSYRALAQDVMDLIDGRKELFRPFPLSDNQLNDLFAGRPIGGDVEVQRKAGCSGSRRGGMGSCASRGAVFEAGRITDLPIVVHGPGSCGYVMAHTQDSHYLSDMDSNHLLVPKMRNNIVCTGMTNSSSVFGGMSDLRSTLRDVLSKGHDTVAVVTTCVSGMIGDDVDRVAEDIMHEHPGSKVIVVHADGNLSGDSEEGRLQVIDALIGLIDDSVEPSDRTRLNLVDDTFMWFNRGMNGDWVRELIRPFGMDIGVRLFEDCTLEDLRTSRRNVFNVPVDSTYMDRGIIERLRSKGFSTWLPVLPKGFSATVEWIGLLGTLTGNTYMSRCQTSAISDLYSEAVDMASVYLRGKTVDLVSASGTDIDWMIEALIDAGAVVRTVYVIRLLGEEQHSRYRGSVEFRSDLAPRTLRMLLAEDPPDLLVGGGGILSDTGVRSMPMPQECIGHQASISFLLRAAGAVRSPPEEGWRRWGGAA